MRAPVLLVLCSWRQLSCKVKMAMLILGWLAWASKGSALKPGVCPQVDVHGCLFGAFCTRGSRPELQ